MGHLSLHQWIFAIRINPHLSSRHSSLPMRPRFSGLISATDGHFGENHQPHLLSCASWGMMTSGSGLLRDAKVSLSVAFEISAMGILISAIILLIPQSQASKPAGEDCLLS